MTEPKQENTQPPAGYVKREDVEEIVRQAIEKRDAEHAKETEQLRAALPADLTPAHSGGPQHRKRASWSLAEQEAALRGDHLEHWDE